MAHAMAWTTSSTKNPAATRSSSSRRNAQRLRQVKTLVGLMGAREHTPNTQQSHCMRMHSATGTRENPAAQVRTAFSNLGFTSSRPQVGGFGGSMSLITRRPSVGRPARTSPERSQAAESPCIGSLAGTGFDAEAACIKQISSIGRLGSRNTELNPQRLRSLTLRKLTHRGLKRLCESVFSGWHGVGLAEQNGLTKGTLDSRFELECWGGVVGMCRLLGAHLIRSWGSSCAKSTPSHT